jgi:hypothetical protein
MRTLARTLLVTNFVMLVVLAGPGSSRKLYLAQEKLGIAHAVTYAFQFWFVVSTVVATTLFILTLVSKSQRALARRPTKLDWMLFLSWTFLVIVVCLFAFMVGHGG